VRLPEFESASIERFARQHRLTLNTVVAGAWALLLSRYNGASEVVFGATVSGRSIPLAGVESILGPCINAIPIRTRIDPSARLLEWLAELQRDYAEAGQYEYAPLASIQRWSELSRGAPLFESLLAFENYPLDRSLTQQATRLRVRDVKFWQRTNYPLTVVVLPARELTLRIEYDRRRFSPASMNRALNRLRQLLEGFIRTSEGRVGDVEFDSSAALVRLPPITR
jgi:non-ribosomal peptide synthetase component F